MQSALATTSPIKNRLFALSLELQVLIYGYVDWEERGGYRGPEEVFLRCHPDIVRNPMLNYWAWQYYRALQSVPLLKSVYFCKFCESPRFREENKIIRKNKRYTAWRQSACSAMCEHLDIIRAEAGHYNYCRLESYKPGYKAHYARIYKEYFEDPENKFDKDRYEELCLIHPEKRIY